MDQGETMRYAAPATRLVFVAGLFLVVVFGLANRQARAEPDPAWANLGMYNFYDVRTNHAEWEDILGRDIPFVGVNYGWRACKADKYSDACLKEPWTYKPEMVANAEHFFGSGRQSMRGRPDVTMVVAVPLAFMSPDEHTCDDETVRQHLQEVVDGKWDRWYEEVARLAKDAGHGHAIYRLGIEPDGCRPWQSKNANHDDYRDAWRHVWTIFKEISTDSRFDYNGAYRFWQDNPVAGLPNAEASYPGKGADGVAPPRRLGDDWVDIISLDQYDSNHSFDRARRELGRTLDMAKKYGKAFAVPEWGVWSVVDDRAAFLTFMYEWMNTVPAQAGVPLAYHSYFNQPPPFVSSLDKNPKAKAEFIRLFSARPGRAPERGG